MSLEGVVSNDAIPIAVAALVTALGGTPAEADAVTHLLWSQDKPVSPSPSAVIEDVQGALAQVRATAERGVHGE